GNVVGKVLGGGSTAFTGVGVRPVLGSAFIGQDDGYRFSLTAAAATGKTLSSGGSSHDDVHTLDATVRTTRSTSATVGSQWSIDMTTLQDDWSGTNPSVTLGSSDTNVATVDQLGNVTYVGTGDFQIIATSTPAAMNDPNGNVYVREECVALTNAA